MSFRYLGSDLYSVGCGKPWSDWKVNGAGVCALISVWACLWELQGFFVCFWGGEEKG